MSTLDNPLILRDFSRGRYAQSSVNDSDIPPNSVSGCTNVNFDQIIGSAVVRPGTTIIGTTIASNKTPLGFAEYVSSKGTVINNLIAVYSGASNASVYYYNGSSWQTSNLTSLSNSANNRFAMLGNQIFIVNGVDKMRTSSDGGATWGTTNSIDASGTIAPSLVFRTNAMLLAAGDASQSPSRVFFSSVVDPTTSPGTITWNTNAATGNWIDINPDDGDTVTAFAETSNTTLIFKNHGMYRIDIVTTAVDPQNVFNIGAVSQEAVVNCRGTVYFFSGNGIFRTTGDLPEEISRLGVGDIISQISQANWSLVAAGTDDQNVYFSVGNITLNPNKNNQRTYNNVVLKFSVRDETWSVHSYAQQPRFYTKYTDSNGRLMRSVDTLGDAQTVNIGTTDNGTPIFYEVITQAQEMGDRAHLDKISDRIIVFTQNALDSQFQAAEGENDFKDIQINFDGSRVTISTDINLEDYYFYFRWFGNSSGTAPVFEGFQIETMEDKGVVTK